MSSSWTVAFVCLAAVVFLVGLLVLGLFRRIIPLLEDVESSLAVAARRVRVTGLPAGAVVPPFTARDIRGSSFSNDDLRGERSLTLFLGEGCRACELLANDIAADEVPELEARLVVVTSSRHGQDLAPAVKSGVTVLVDDDQVIAHLFESDRTPQAFVTDENARVAVSGVPNDWDAVRDLIATGLRGGAREVNGAAASLAQH